MNIFEKAKWRFDYIIGNKPVLMSGLIPLFLTGRLSTQYPVLAEAGKKKIIAFEKKDDAFFIKFLDFTFKIPVAGFVEGDFFDIIYQPILGKKIKKPFFFEGPYEMEGVSLNEGDFVIDAGANVGLFSIFSSKKVTEKGKVFSFEPMENVISFLRNNIQSNKRTNIEIFQMALGEEEKEVFFSSDGGFEGYSKHFGESKNIPVHQITIDNFVEKNKIEKINFIKADIEGSERDMLRGGEKTIKRFKPKLSIRTYHLPDDPEVLEKIIHEFVPEYKIEHGKKTIYAWVE